MVENISITFGVGKSGLYLFYVRAGEGEFFIYENEVSEIDIDDRINELGVGVEAKKYIKEMYERWVSEYIERG